MPWLPHEKLIPDYGVQNGVVTLENYLAVSNTDVSAPGQPSTLSHLPRELEQVFQRTAHTTVRATMSPPPTQNVHRRKDRPWPICTSKFNPTLKKRYLYNHA